MSGDSFCDGFNHYIEGTIGSIRSFRELVNANGKIYSLSGYLSGCNGAWTYDANTVASKKEIFENHILEIFQEYDLDLIVYPTTKNKVFTLNSGGSVNGPGSFLGSVIGYPSITVPMGSIDEFSYGLEFFSIKGEENLLYSVANVFEELNDLELTNSPLTPSLYEIPEYINTLKNYYEKEENELTAKTKTFFLNYSNNTEEENEKQAQELIGEYQTLEQNKEKQVEKDSILNVFLTILFIFITISTILFILIYRLLTKKISKLYRKMKK